MSNRTPIPERASAETSPIRVFSDPHAFLRPLYRRLTADRGFHLIAESMQFDRLVEAAAEVSETHAAKMREYNAETKRAILGQLERAESLRSGPAQVEVWTLRKDDRELVRASANNFAGIGATDTHPAPAMFPDARTGVRAQIQHLRAYGDPTASTCTVPPLANPCVDPRFQLVTPKGKAPTWNQMGNGNWASASTYATSILALYADALAFNGARALSAREADVDQRGIVIRNAFGLGRIRSPDFRRVGVPGDPRPFIARFHPSAWT